MYLNLYKHCIFLLLQLIFISTECSFISTSSETPHCGPRLVKCHDLVNFTMCFGGKLVGPRISCPTNKICDENSDFICVVPPEKTRRSKPKLNFDTFEKIKEEEKLENEEEIPVCSPYVDSSNNASFCSSLLKNTNYTLPGTGCRKFIHCSDVEKVYECPDGYYFDGIICSSSFVCPKPCKPVSKHHVKDNIIKSSLVIYNSGLGRWPVKGTSCKLYTDWSYDKFGKIIGVTQKCPELSWFDPIEQRCRVRYLCEEEPNYARPCEDNIDHGYCDPELTIPTCIDSKPLAIANSGCHYYITCHIQKTLLLKCPDDYLFDPNKRACTKNYVCPKICTLYPEEGFPTKEPKYPECSASNILLPVSNSECSQYIECKFNIKEVKSCPTSTWFDPNTQLCVSDYKCPDIPCVPKDNLKSFAYKNICDSEELEKLDDMEDLVKSVVKTYDVYKHFDLAKVIIPRCDNEGLFEIGALVNCTNYVSCTNTKTGYKADILNCINNTKFDPKLKECSKSYICIEQSNDIIETENIMSACILADRIVPKCTADGKYPVIYSDCKDYIVCKFSLFHIGWISNEFRCSGNSLFDPVVGICSSSYACEEIRPCREITYDKNEKKAKDESKSEYINCDNGIQIEIPECKVKSTGTEEIKGTGCKKYMICTLIIGEFKSKIFRCPDNYYFNPNKGKCDNYYQCQDEDLCAEDLPNYILSRETTISPYPAYKCPENKENLSIPICFFTGKFLLKNSGCKKYILCLRVIDGFVPKVKECPAKTYFNPVTKSCEFTYFCKDFDKCAIISQ